MDTALIESWNTAVKPNNTVYIMGDLFFRNTVSADDYLQRLNGKKHLLIGNHDKDWMKKADTVRHFESVDRMIEFSDGAHKITLCHYPLMTWNGVAKGTYMIYGHVHSNTGAKYAQFVKCRR